MIHAFIDRHRGQYPIAMACRVLGVSRSGVHASRTRPESERARADAALTVLIAASHVASRHSYGAPRVLADLREQGHRVGERRVARLMRRAGLRGAYHARRPASARSPARTVAPVESPDLVRRHFRADGPDRLWCADVKQIWTGEGWLFLAAIIDLYSRRIVGHASGRSATTELVARAFDAAVRRRRPGPGLVHHSDRGAAYVSGPMLASLQAAGAVRSLSRPGTPLDNAVIESFFSTLERELLVGARYVSRAEARASLFAYIEVFYNRHRRHSSLDYLTPTAFEARAAHTGVSTKTA